jgi:serine/threonine-protein kinase
MIGGVHHEERSELARAMPAYEIGEVLGRGAFAVVYAARHVQLRREVAIKRLAPDLLRERAARERFAAEARLLASLDHPHVVRVHDYVEEEVVCALVMERLHGGSLAERVQIDRPSCVRACAIMVAALYGLEHAHRRGVLHRDVKPDNVLFGEFDTVKVVDFGIAKVIGAKGTRLTATAAILGTPAFMAPEQVSSSVGPLSAATDVWGAGAVLYELLAGEPPFSREGDLGEVLFQRITESPRPLHALVSDVPPAVADAVMRSLARHPADRHPTASAFARALEDAVGHGLLTGTGIPVHRSASGPADGGTATLAGTTDALAAAPPTARETAGAAPSLRTALVALRVHRRWTLLLVAALAAVGTSVVLALSSGGGAGGGGGSRSGGGGGSSDALAALPKPPPGWPKTMALGTEDPRGEPANLAKLLKGGGLAYQAFGINPPGAHEDPAKPYAAWFASEAHRHGLLPYAAFYQLRTLGQPPGHDGQAPQLRATFRDRSLMQTYWRNVRRFLRALGSAAVPAAVVVEPSVWALMEADLAPSGALPNRVSVHVSDVGLTELRSLPDTLPGLARGWLALRNRYARKVQLGYGVTDYGTGFDISRQVWPHRTLVAAARAAGQFYMDLTIFDFASLEIAYDEEGQDPNRLMVYSPAEKDGVVTFVREFVRTTKMPMVLDSVPRGNSVMKTIDDDAFHWRDSWVQWLIGTDDFSGLTKLRDAGAIGIAFGVGNGNERNATCFCDAAKDGVTNDGRRGRPATSADDDGGYFAQRAAALRRAGGLALVR